MPNDEWMDVLADDQMKHGEAPSDEELNAMYEATLQPSRLATAVKYAEAHPLAVDWQKTSQLLDMLGDVANLTRYRAPQSYRDDEPMDFLKEVEQENVRAARNR